MRLPISVVFLCVGIGLAACADYSGSAQKPPAKPSAPQGDVGESAQTSAKAVVDVFLGRVDGEAVSYRNWHASDFYINGVAVGLVDRHNCLRVELDPGVYYFSWRLHDPILTHVTTAQAVDLLQPSQRAYVSLNMERNAGALLGPIGWWADPDRSSMVDTYPDARRIPATGCSVRANPAVMANIHPIVSATTNLPQRW